MLSDWKSLAVKRLFETDDPAQLSKQRKYGKCKKLTLPKITESKREFNL